MMDSLPSDEIESSPPPNPHTITTTTSFPTPDDSNQPPPIPQQQDLPTQNPSSPLPDSHLLQTLESADPDPPHQDPDLHHLQDDPDDPEGMPITLISDSNVEEKEIEIEALPPSSSSRRAPPSRRKKGLVKTPHPKTLAAVEKKVQALSQKWKVIPFVPNKALDFSRHEENLRRLGLWEFAHFEFDSKIRVDLLAKLIVTYNSKGGCSSIDGVKVRVTPTDLARALSLSKKPKPADSAEEEVVWPEDFLAFLAEFVSNWMLLHEDTWILPKEMINWTGMIKEGHPEKVDWTKLIWFMVRREVCQGPELENCYYASHLQHLIRFQRKELFREKSPMEVQEVIMLKEDEEEEGDVKMAECEVSHGGEPEMKLENVQPTVAGFGSVQSEQSVENVVNLGFLGNVSDAENVGNLAHGDITIGCVGGFENPETAGHHGEILQKAVEHVEIPEKAVELVGSQEKAIEHVGSPEKAVELVVSPEKAVECVGSPEKAVELVGSPEKAVEHAESPEKAVEQQGILEKVVERVGSPEKAVEPVESPEKAVEPVESPEKAVEHVEIPEAVEQVEVPKTAVEHVEILETAVENVEMSVERVEIPDKPIENVEKAVEHVENPEKTVDQEENVEMAVDHEENVEMAVDQLGSMAAVGDHAVNLDNTGGHADKLETATGHVDEQETACDQVQKLEAAADLVMKLETAGDLVENMNVAGNYAEDMKMDGDNVEDANITRGDDDVYDFKSEDEDVHADDTQIQGTSGNDLMDFEPIKADDDEQDIWDLPRKDGEQGHFLRHCTMSEVEVDEEHTGQEDGQPEEVEDDEEEDDEQVEGFDALQKCNSFSGLSSGHLMQAMDPSQIPYAASDFGDQSSLGLLSTRGDNHLMLGGPSSLFGSAPKRELEHDPEMPGHSLNDSHKRMRTEGPSWDQKPPDFDMCFDQMQQWLAKARMAYMSSQDAMMSQQQMISYELGNKDHIIQQLKLSLEDQQRRHQAELARYDNELYAMNSVISGYRKALKSTQQNFAEYRKRAALPLEPLYKDAGVGGVVKTVADLEKERLKQEEEDRVALTAFKSTAQKLEEEYSQTFKAHLERVEMLQARVPDIEKGVELLRESMRKRKEASETVGLTDLAPVNVNENAAVEL